MPQRPSYRLVFELTKAELRAFNSVESGSHHRTLEAARRMHEKIQNAVAAADRSNGVREALQRRSIMTTNSEPCALCHVDHHAPGAPACPEVAQVDKTLWIEGATPATSENFLIASSPGSLVFQTGAGGAHPGGDVRVIAQAAQPTGRDIGSIPVTHGSLQFQIAPGGVEVLRFYPDGRVFVRGRLVDTDREIYEGFRDWLAAARATAEESSGGMGGALTVATDPRSPSGLKLRALQLDAAGEPSRVAWLVAAKAELYTLYSGMLSMPKDFATPSAFRSGVAEIVACLANACKPLAKDTTRAVVNRFLGDVGLS